MKLRDPYHDLAVELAVLGETHVVLEVPTVLGTLTRGTFDEFLFLGGPFTRLPLTVSHLVLRELAILAY